MSNAMPGTYPDPTSTTPKQLSGPITMHDFSFDPAYAQVKVGTNVTWENLDAFAHTVTSDDGTTLLDSGDIGDHASWSFTFTQPGTYDYRCLPHSYSQTGSYHGMIGKIIVVS